MRSDHEACVRVCVCVCLEITDALGPGSRPHHIQWLAHIYVCGFQVPKAMQAIHTFTTTNMAYSPLQSVLCVARLGKVCAGEREF